MSGPKGIRGLSVDLRCCDQWKLQYLFISAKFFLRRVMGQFHYECPGIQRRFISASKKKACEIVSCTSPPPCSAETGEIPLRDASCSRMCLPDRDSGTLPNEDGEVLRQSAAGSMVRTEARSSVYLTEFNHPSSPSLFDVPNACRFPAFQILCACGFHTERCVV